MQKIIHLALSSARLFAVLGFGLTASVAGQPAKADENWTAAQAAFNTCLGLFPDVRAIRKEMKAAGWRFEGDHGQLRIYSLNSFRALAATQSADYEAARCFVSSSKLSAEDAVKYATKIAKSFKNAKPIDLSARGVPAAWEVTIRGQKVKLGVIAKAEFGVMRGAGVALGEF